MTAASTTPHPTPPAHRALGLLMALGLLVAAAGAPPARAQGEDGGAAAAVAPTVAPDEYAARRAQVMEALGPDALLLLTSPQPAPRNGDVHWPFRQDDDLYYLTGVDQPGTALVLVPAEERYREVLFARDRDPQAEVWTGPIPSHGELAAASGIEEVHSSGGEWSFLQAALNGAAWGPSEVYRYYRRPVTPAFLEAVRAGRAEVWLDLGGRPLGDDTPSRALRLARQVRSTFPEVRLRDAAPLLASLREVKSPAELELIARAVEITEAAIRAGMRRAPHAERENQLQATVEFTFRDLGACCWGFPSIVAAGANTTVLHYEAGEAPIPEGGLVLFDVGADYRGYTADISRTFPADGTFSPTQREIHDAVHRTWEALLPELTAGRPYQEINARAHELLGAELAELGLVTDPHDRDQTALYFRHGLGHPLGLQVHDVFDRTRALEPGMVWTLEPGLYVRPDDVTASPAFQALPEDDRASIRAALERYAGIGVRIEDDVLITRGAPVLLSDGTPRSAEEIERFMASAATPAQETTDR